MPKLHLVMMFNQSNRYKIKIYHHKVTLMITAQPQIKEGSKRTLCSSVLQHLLFSVLPSPSSFNPHILVSPLFLHNTMSYFPEFLLFGPPSYFTICGLSWGRGLPTSSGLTGKDESKHYIMHRTSFHIKTHPTESDSNYEIKKPVIKKKNVLFLTHIISSQLQFQVDTEIILNN